MQFRNTLIEFTKIRRSKRVTFVSIIILISIILQSTQDFFSGEICGKAFEHKNNCRDHIRAAHTNERPEKCDKCDKCFVSSSLLKRHKRDVHSGGGVCPICSKVVKGK